MQVYIGCQTHLPILKCIMTYYDSVSWVWTNCLNILNMTILYESWWFTAGFVHFGSNKLQDTGDWTGVGDQKPRVPRVISDLQFDGCDTSRPRIGWEFRLSPCFTSFIKRKGTFLTDPRPFDIICRNGPWMPTLNDEWPSKLPTRRLHAAPQPVLNRSASYHCFSIQTSMSYISSNATENRIQLSSS